MYNLTELQNADTVWKLIDYANDAAEQTLLGTFIIAIFFIMLFVLKKWGIDNALLTSSFVCFIISGILTYAKLLNFIYPLAFLAATAFTLFYMVVVGRKE